MASGLHNHDQSGGWWPECYGQLPTGRPVSHSTGLAHGNPSEHSLFLGRSLCQVHQQLLGHFYETWSRMGSLPDTPEERRVPLGIHPEVHEEENTIPSVSDAVVTAYFRKGVRVPDLLKKLSRRQQETIKE